MVGFGDFVILASWPLAYSKVLVNPEDPSVEYSTPSNFRDFDSSPMDKFSGTKSMTFNDPIPFILYRLVIKSGDTSPLLMMF